MGKPILGSIGISLSNILLNGSIDVLNVPFKTKKIKIHACQVGNCQLLIKGNYNFLLFPTMNPGLILTNSKFFKLAFFLSSTKFQAAFSANILLLVYGRAISEFPQSFSV